jgi:ATP-dependent protease ClpP protease subunit
MAQPRLAWSISNVSSDEVDLHVYDVIGDPYEGTDAAQFVRDLSEITASTINLHINSPGGYVNDALAMYNALLNHPAFVNAYNDGHADSAASFLMQAADKRYIARNASMLIHPAQAIALGDEADMRASADRLAEESRNIASIYAERSGGTAEDWLARMTAENGSKRGTSYRGQEAVDVGLVDEITAIPARAATRRMAAIAEGRIAAVSEFDDVPDEITDLGRSIREGARLERAAPSLEQRLSEQMAKEPLSKAITGVQTHG